MAPLEMAELAAMVEQADSLQPEATVATAVSVEVAAMVA